MVQKHQTLPKKYKHTYYITKICKVLKKQTQKVSKEYQKNATRKKWQNVQKIVSKYAKTYYKKKSTKRNKKILRKKYKSVQKIFTYIYYNKKLALVIEEKKKTAQKINPKVINKTYQNLKYGIELPSDFLLQPIGQDYDLIS